MTRRSRSEKFSKPLSSYSLASWATLTSIGRPMRCAFPSHKSTGKKTPASVFPPGSWTGGREYGTLKTPRVAQLTQGRPGRLSKIERSRALRYGIPGTISASTKTENAWQDRGGVWLGNQDSNQSMHTRTQNAIDLDGGAALAGGCSITARASSIASARREG
jgi:hypothetical protein